ncbi:uncharacterized protein [Montipora foliosa]|uniref:uncharacterized protein isoform X1 n=1 Tax=Montipora foliosa TaxID=591990 RepID=UPI0035F21316
MGLIYSLTSVKVQNSSQKSTTEEKENVVQDDSDGDSEEIFYETVSLETSHQFSSFWDLGGSNKLSDELYIEAKIEHPVSEENKPGNDSSERLIHMENFKDKSSSSAVEIRNLTDVCSKDSSQKEPEAGLKSASPKNAKNNQGTAEEKEQSCHLLPFFPGSVFATKGAEPGIKLTGPSQRVYPYVKDQQRKECSTLSLPLISDERAFQGTSGESIPEPEFLRPPSSSHVELKSDTPLPCAWQIDVDCFKSKKRKKLPSKYFGSKENKDTVSAGMQTLDSSNWLVSSQIATKETMASRKVLDPRRWYCISRPQYKKSCGISALVSCWNFLFSTLGVGRWFRQLNGHFGVRGDAYYMYKPKGKSRTVGLTGNEALRRLKEGLQNPQMAFIYHSYNHYFCPIGYDDSPIKAVNAYRSHLHEEGVETWILIGDTSCKHPSIHCKRWEDIDKDLNNESPFYLNIRQLHEGIKQLNTKKTGGNLHCIMAFQKSAFQGSRAKTESKITVIQDINNSNDDVEEEENAMSDL